MNVTLYPGTWEYFNNSFSHERGNAACPACIEQKPIQCKCGGLKHHHIRPDYGEPFENEYECFCENCGDEDV